MSKKLYVANLSFKATEQDVEELFKEHGEVASVRLIFGDQGRHRGFGFVEMVEDQAAKNAIEALNGASFMDRDLVVDEARVRDRDRNTGGGYNRDRGDRPNHHQRDWPRSSQYGSESRNNRY